MQKQFRIWLERCQRKLNESNKAESNMGVLWGLLTLVAVLMIAGIFMALGANLTNDVRTDFVDQTTRCGLNESGGTEGTLLYDGCGLEWNITGKALDAQYTVAKKQSLISTVGIISIVLGLLMSVIVGFLAYTRYF